MSGRLANLARLVVVPLAAATGFAMFGSSHWRWASARS